MHVLQSKSLPNLKSLIVERIVSTSVNLKWIKSATQAKRDGRVVALSYAAQGRLGTKRTLRRSSMERENTKAMQKLAKGASKELLKLDSKYPDLSDAEVRNRVHLFSTELRQFVTPRYATPEHSGR